MAGLLDIFGDYPVLTTLLGILVLGTAAYIADRLSRSVLLTIVNRVVRESSFRFDDVLLEANVFGRLAHLAPLIVTYVGIQLVPGIRIALFEVPGADGAPAQLWTVATLIQHAAASVMVLVVVSALAGFLTAVGRTYATSEIAEGRPIEAYVQVAKIVVYVVGIVLFISTLIGLSPLYLLGGLGAIAAVLMLVFRDTILSFVASLQITNYDMLRVGDWIEMSQYGADGDVIEISLHTVKVQNWDKTITAIPTHKLIEQPFKNWRGMQESGGRRIKRSFFVDTNTIRFLEDEDLDRLENFEVLRDYVQTKRGELADYNEAHASDPSLILNARKLTNIGTLRAYLVGYLRHHPKVHQGMTLIVRQLAPTSEGVPIELYVFTNITDWVAYEDIQSDIFDHIFSIVHEFDLKVFQAPTGADFARLGRGG